MLGDVDMAKQSLSDEELIARHKHKIRLLTIINIVVILPSFYVVYLLSPDGWPGLSMQERLSYLKIYYAFLAALLIFDLILAWPSVALAEARARAYHKDVDTVHRAWRKSTIIAVPIVVAGAILNTVISLSAPSDYGVPDWHLIAVLVFCILPFVQYAFFICFGPGWLFKAYRKKWNDELMIALRARIVRLAYLLLVFGMAGLYFVQYFVPRLAIVALIWILCACTVIPMFYFLHLERRAEIGD